MHGNDYLKLAGGLSELKDWFVGDGDIVDHLASTLIPDNDPPSCIRYSPSAVIEGRKRLGVPSELINAELANLAEQAREIAVARSPGDWFRAAVFYHLKFEAIHPLTDGNGRIGRFLLAMQCSSCWKIAPHLLLDGILENAPAYRDVFLATIPDEQRFELLLDILIRVAGLPPPYPSSQLKNSLVPQNVFRQNAQFRFFTASNCAL